MLAENYPLFAISCQFLEDPPTFKENLPEKGPLFREFQTQKPTHMGGTYPYPQHVMLPLPPGTEEKGPFTVLVPAPNGGGANLDAGLAWEHSSQENFPGPRPLYIKKRPFYSKNTVVCLSDDKDIYLTPPLTLFQQI